MELLQAGLHLSMFRSTATSMYRKTIPQQWRQHCPHFLLIFCRLGPSANSVAVEKCWKVDHKPLSTAFSEPRFKLARNTKHGLLPSPITHSFLYPYQQLALLAHCHTSGSVWCRFVLLLIVPMLVTGLACLRTVLWCPPQPACPPPPRAQSSPLHPMSFPSTQTSP